MNVTRYHEQIPGYNFNFFVGLDSITNHFHMHRHDFLEIYVVISGKGKEYINGIEYILQRGSLTFLLPWHTHEIFTDNTEPLRLIRCNFGMEMIMEDINNHSGLMSIIYNYMYAAPSTQLSAETTDKVISIFEDLLEEFKGEKICKELLMKAKITELLVYFTRMRTKDTAAVSPSDLMKNEENDINNLLPYIHINWNQDITLTDLAAKFNRSEVDINCYLHNHTGLNYSDYLNEVRIRLSCAMLSIPELKILEISQAAGFKSIKAFYRTFKKFKGFSPDEFRKYYLSDEGRKDTFLFPSPLMWKIIHYIRLHYNEDLTLSRVAAEFHYSDSSLSELCKRQTGQGFTDILHEIRIFHACSLLVSSDSTITDICFEVGFNSSETFFRVFKRLKGLSPEKYRKNAMNFSLEPLYTASTQAIESDH